jgi:hypothetical protein
MPEVTQVDLRAAVAAGVMTDIASRRADASPALVRDGHDIFVALGVVLLFGGLSTWADKLIPGPACNPHVISCANPILAPAQYLPFAALSCLSVLLAIALCIPLIRRRQMTLPGIALMIFAAQILGAIIPEAVVSHLREMTDGARLALHHACHGIVMGAVGVWLWLRSPFALFLFALPITLGLSYAALLPMAEISNPWSSKVGPFIFNDQLVASLRIIVMVGGVLSVVAAMRFDLSDRFRLTRRAECAFRLHAAAAQRALLATLPAFPGKDRLPPWDAASAARP